MSQIVLIAHNIRSCYNVGSLFRTSEGLGIQKLYLTGYTPYPRISNDQRPPHIQKQLTKQIAKTALGAENHVDYEYLEDPALLLHKLQRLKYVTVALEQADQAIPLPDYKPPRKIALLLGEEVNGVPDNLLRLCQQAIFIPMKGVKESFNVAVAAAIALYAIQAASRESR